MKTLGELVQQRIQRYQLDYIKRMALPETAFTHAPPLEIEPRELRWRKCMVMHTWPLHEMQSDSDCTPPVLFEVMRSLGADIDSVLNRQCCIETFQPAPPYNPYIEYREFELPNGFDFFLMTTPHVAGTYVELGYCARLRGRTIG